jgi:cell wall-associated NlpC family hydrolase
VPDDWPGTYCPNFSDWAPGDIVLVHRTQDITGILLAAGQLASLKSSIRKSYHVTHAGIYVGGGRMIDATPGRPVDTVSLWEYCQTRPLELRRVPDVVGQDIADAANSHLGQSYSILQVVLSKLVPGTKVVPDAVYCSILVGAVVTEATGIVLESDPKYRPLYPAVLARHPGLQIVNLEWFSL